jgi:hypothetical protein
MDAMQGPLTREPLFQEAIIVALSAIRQATIGPGGMYRPAAIRWRQLLQQASGEEREQIGFMAEALIASASDPADAAFVQQLINLSDELPAELVEQTINLAIAEQRSRDTLLKAAQTGRT